MDMVMDFISAHPFLVAILSPVWGAIVIDAMAFAKTKEPGDWLAQFNVKLALTRYLQAFVGGIAGNFVVAGAVAGAGAVALVLWW